MITVLTIIFAFAIAAAGTFIFTNKDVKLAGFAGILAGTLALLVHSFTIVSPGHVGVQITMGTVNLEPLSEGAHFINPISQVKELEVRLVKEQIANSPAGTKDQQQVHTDITVNYRLKAEKAGYIFKDYGLDVADKVLVPAVNEALKSVTAKYTAEELLTKRDEVSATVLQHIKDKVEQYDISINSVSMANFTYSPDYQKSIEAKVIATQNKLKAEQDLQRIEVEARQAIAVAEGKAKAIQIETTAINSQGGQNYIELKRIEKWDGKLPTTMAGSVPFFNVNK